MSATGKNPADFAEESPLRRSVTVLAGLGPRRAEALARLGIRNLEDLLRHAPRRYEDRRRATAIADAQVGELAVFVGEIASFGTKFLRGRGRHLFEARLVDESGTLHLRWWNGGHLEKAFAIGKRVVAFGKLTTSEPPSLDHPDFEWLEDRAFVPELRAVYPSAAGLTQKLWRRWIGEARILCAGQWSEPLPQWDCHPWPSRERALEALHHPKELWEPEIARARLALDEWIEFRLELAERRRRRLRRVTEGPPSTQVDGRALAALEGALPFEFTKGQRSAIERIAGDMASQAPMRRLLQGDVGSGKTAVAAAAAALILEQGRDVVFMAPTDILARQHRDQLAQWFKASPIAVRLVVGGQHEETDGEQPTLHVGTSALIHRTFDRRPLGLSVIDEQHRFGVAQRVALMRKDPRAHMLAMTATPIPRTLAMTVFADLELIELRDIPPGRAPGATYVRGPEKMEAIYAFVREEVAAGRQAFFVFPRIEPAGDRNDDLALEARYEEIESALRPARVGKAHGGMPQETMQKSMEAFARGTIQVLAATSVIEVGINVPNASVMVILGSERFGLAQLHQLRGRVRRGSHVGRCILVTASEESAALDRLHQFTETEDGFEIAELDWRQRGSGAFLGKAQSGKGDFRFADPMQDFALADQAKWLVEHYAESGNKP